MAATHIRGPVAPPYRAGDGRFESCRGHSLQKCLYSLAPDGSHRRDELQLVPGRGYASGQSCVYIRVRLSEAQGPMVQLIINSSVGLSQCGAHCGTVRVCRISCTLGQPKSDLPKHC